MPKAIDLAILYYLLMKHQKFLLFLATTLLLCGASCPGETTIVRFTKTINLLESVTPSVGAMTGRTITGFKLGEFTSERDLLRTSTTGPILFDLEGAGSESPPCHDGTPYRRAAISPMIRILSLIGDTGNEDVSDDDDCRCDSHIEFIEFVPIEIAFEDGGVLRIPAGSIKGRYLLCPNTRENHLISGDREFGGAVIATFNCTLRVSDSGDGLYADIQYDLREQ